MDGEVSFTPSIDQSGSGLIRNATIIGFDIQFDSLNAPCIMEHSSITLVDLFSSESSG